MRFQDRLEVRVAIDPALDGALVPALVLQPLVENAIRHGVEARIGASRVDVVARRAAGNLILEVTDSGDAHAPTLEAGRDRDGVGVGLRATRERLTHLFGSACRFALEVEPGRSRATIEIPYRAGAAP
jgi:LytS/YehU family sensor histidine kinase